MTAGNQLSAVLGGDGSRRDKITTDYTPCTGRRGRHRDLSGKTPRQEEGGGGEGEGGGERMDHPTPHLTSQLKHSSPLLRLPVGPGFWGWGLGGGGGGGWRGRWVTPV